MRMRKTLIVASLVIILFSLLPFVSLNDNDAVGPQLGDYCIPTQKGERSEWNIWVDYSYGHYVMYPSQGPVHTCGFMGSSPMSIEFESDGGGVDNITFYIKPWHNGTYKFNVTLRIFNRPDGYFWNGSMWLSAEYKELLYTFPDTGFTWEVDIDKDGVHAFDMTEGFIFNWTVNNLYWGDGHEIVYIVVKL